MKNQPTYNLSVQELDKVIGLVRNILPDVDEMPAKAKFKINRLAEYFEMHRDILVNMLESQKKK